MILVLASKSGCEKKTIELQWYRHVTMQEQKRFVYSGTDTAVCWIKNLFCIALWYRHVIGYRNAHLCQGVYQFNHTVPVHNLQSQTTHYTIRIYLPDILVTCTIRVSYLTCECSLPVFEPAPIHSSDQLVHQTTESLCN